MKPTKEVFLITKYYPIVVNIYIATIMVLSLIGINNNILYVLLGQTFLLNRQQFLLSKIFNLCSWHRILIYSQTACLILETLTLFNFKINNYIYIVLGIIAVSLIVITIIFYKRGRIQQKFGKHI